MSESKTLRMTDLECWTVKNRKKFGGKARKRLGANVLIHFDLQAESGIDGKPFH